MQHSTQADTHPCRSCGTPIMSAWDEGLIAHVDVRPIESAVADALDDLPTPVPVYVLSRAKWLTRRTMSRRGGPPYGTLHPAHRCRRNGGTAHWTSGTLW